MNPYLGHATQLSGIEEHRLVGGKGDGLRLLEVTNGLGLQLTLSPDRCCDIPRLRYRGIGLNYFSPCGYVAPAYYDPTGTNWLKSFTAGFLTTCGLQAVGSPCVDGGETLPLHGSIANQPCDTVFWQEDEENLTVHARVSDEQLFGRKLRLCRRISVSKTQNRFLFCDEIENTGDRTEPLEVLYHMNMGYPLLDEDSVVTIPSSAVTARDAHAEEDLAHWMRMEKPQPGYQERCYYHRFADGRGRAAIWQPKRGLGLRISFDARRLDGFVEWKMMGVRDYVLGLECGNCYPDGRDVMRRTGMLKWIEPGQKLCYSFDVEMLDAPAGAGC